MTPTIMQNKPENLLARYDVHNPYPVGNHWCIARHHRAASHRLVKSPANLKARKNPGAGPRVFPLWLPRAFGGGLPQGPLLMCSLANCSPVRSNLDILVNAKPPSADGLEACIYRQRLAVRVKA